MKYLVMWEVGPLGNACFIKSFRSIASALRQCKILADRNFRGCLFYDKPVMRQSDEILSWG